MRAGKATTIAAMLASLVFAAPAAAQTVPEGQSCGGLFCDLGIVGHKVTPATPPVSAPANPPLAKSPAANPGSAKQAEAEAAEPKKQAARRKKPAAKLAAVPAAPTPVALKPIAPQPAALQPVAPPSVEAPVAVAPPPAATSVASPTAAALVRPTPNVHSVINNPYAVPQTSPFAFPSIYPPNSGEP